MPRCQQTNHTLLQPSVFAQSDALSQQHAQYSGVLVFLNCLHTLWHAVLHYNSRYYLYVLAIMETPHSVPYRVYSTNFDHSAYSTLSSAYCLPLMLDAGVTGLPARRPVEVPPSSWIEDMRTPAADLILMEFHRQKYSMEGEADGQENASPNSAFHTDPAPQPDSPISGLLALCFCPSAHGRCPFVHI